MVGMSYTGVDGRITRFNAKSPIDAMNRLNGIKGYGGNVMDSAAAGLAGAFAAKHKNATRVDSANNNNTAVLNGASGTNIVSHKAGIASAVDSVKGLHVDRYGNLIAETRTNFVGSDGTVAAVGRSVDKSIGKVGTELSTDNIKTLVGSAEFSDVVANIVNGTVNENSVVNNVVNNNTTITRLVNNNTFITQLVKNANFITQLFQNDTFVSNLAASLATHINFVSMDDSRMRFEVTHSGNEMLVKIGAYYL